MSSVVVPIKSVHLKTPWSYLPRQFPQEFVTDLDDHDRSIESRVKQCLATGELSLHSARYEDGVLVEAEVCGLYRLAGDSVGWKFIIHFTEQMTTVRWL